MKKFIYITLLLLCISITANASILGDTISESSVQIGEGTYYNHNQYYSTQSGVYQQTENYIEYTPNSSVMPIVTNGGYVHGTSTINQANVYLTNSGLRPFAGINADFFSFYTGVPMSHTIIRGRVSTKDEQEMDAIGFLADGSAFIDKLKINATMKVGDIEIDIPNINKYRQPYGPYLFTDEYNKTTKNSTEGIDIIIGDVSGVIKIGKTVTGTVEQIIETSSATEIPSNKWILSIDKNGFADVVEKFGNIKEGDKVTLTVTANDKRWNNVLYGVGATGGRLITDGVVNDIDQTAAPRTAVGIKADGTVIFYTIDGRQSGYSYGVRLKTLAKRLLELGCVDAINLDGGGSTCIQGKLPGDSNMTLLNKPSDKSLRSVSNFMFLINQKQPTGELGNIFIYPYSGYYLSGATEKFSVKGVDTAFYPTDVNTPVTFDVTGTGYAGADGWIELGSDKNGTVTVTAHSDNIENSIELNVINTPDYITILNEANSKEVTSVSLNSGKSINLTAKSYYKRNKLISSDNNYSWTVTNGIGEIDETGTFTASKRSASGEIQVAAGDTVKIIPVTVTNPNETENDKYYTKISFENNILYFDSPYDVSVKDIFIRIDGEEFTGYTYDDEKAELFVPKGAHKIYVELTNSLERTSIGNFILNEYDAETAFSDTDSNWAKNIISYMNENGVINGYNEDGKWLFKPQNNVTRAEFAVMLANLLELDESDVILPFADNKSIPFWAENKIKSVYENGIMAGRATDKGSVVFDATAPITRNEVACAIARILPEGISKSSLDFKDADQIPDWAKESMQKLVSNGIINGYDDKTIKPYNNITRAEVIKILYTIY